MSDKDKMRAEFEAYLKKKEISWLGKFKAFARQFFVAGYAAGQKAEREKLANLRQEVLRVAQKSWWDEPSTTEGEL